MVCVAPDGSIFVSDWYDPGVGGHGQRDLDRGRLFRVAPEGTKYKVPKFDFTTIEGCIEALKNPNLATRYMAWTNLHKQGAKAEAAMMAAYESSDDPRYQARLLWLLGNIEGKGAKYVDVALSADNPNLRIVGLRMAHQLKLPATDVVAKVVNDKSPQVRRQAAIELRFDGSDKASQQWAQLAQQHDGTDRWYLEALGIGARPPLEFSLGCLLRRGRRKDRYAGRPGHRLAKPSQPNTAAIGRDHRGLPNSDRATATLLPGV